ncbi:hypothetical protein JCM3765_003694 [Sporobolomyces pararoseus]
MPSSPPPPSPPSPIDFLTHLISLTLSEQSSEALEFSLLLSNTPLQILVKNGLALTNLSLTNSSNSGGGISIGLGGKTLVELSRNSATTGTGGGGGLGSLGGHHDFRSGDLVKIRNNNSSSSNSNSNKKGSKNGNNRKGKDKVGVEEGMGQEIEAVVYKVLNDKITLVLNDHKSRVSKYIEPESEGGGVDEFEWTDKITLFKVSNPSTFKRQIHFLRQAINALEAVNPHQDQDQDQEEEDEENESDSSSSTDQESTPTPTPTPTPTTPNPNQSISPLLSVLLGLTPPTLSPPPSSNSSSSLKYFDESLNDSQKEAIEFCLNGTRELGLIWGPPGTGKTQTLIEIIKQLILVENKKVLVCGASNLSVDNILSRLTSNSKEGEEKIELTRLGHPARILNELNKHTLDSQSCLNDQTFLVKDIQSELLQLTKELSNRDKKTRLRGSDRKLKWELIKNLKKDMKKRLSSVEKQVLKNKKLVFSTTHGAGSKVLDKMILENGSKFDVVIIDEAAQATEPSCWIPIMRGEKLILAGDHLQLPPTIKSISSSSSSSSSSSTIIGPSPLELSKTLETTLFSRLLSLHGESIRKMLKIQYRFNEKINEFPSKMLYDNELKPSHQGGISERRLGDLLQQQQQQDEEEVEIGEGDLQDLNEPIVFFDTAGLGMYERGGEPGQFGSESKSNENEADIVLNYVKFLIESKIPPSSISIISPYSSQVSLISSSISSSLEQETTTTTTIPSSSSNSRLRDLIQIGSIDSNQGRENDVVIISLVRSNEIGEIGFLKEFKRLNVAMTRARRQLVVVGDSETLKKGGSSLVTTTTTSKKKEKKEGGGGNDEKSNSNSNNEKEIENDSIDERDDDDDDDDDESIGGSSGVEEELEQEETLKSTNSTNGETRKGDKKKKQKKKVTGASYLKEWIEWLEENAYVRVP